MISGQLEIQLLANLARLVADMNTAKQVVSGTMRDISGAVDMAKRALAGLGVSLTASGLVMMVKHAIDAADAMNDLSKSTGIAVEKLAGLRLAAKQSGGDLEGIAASINKLSVNVGKSGDKFRELGITAKDPLEAFKQFADVFAAIDDPQLKAALGAEALGKSWASAAPLLSEGGKKIGEMVEKGEKLSGITKEITEASDAFNDKLVELGGNGGTMNGVLREMLPLLNKVLDDFIALKGEGGGLGTILGVAITEALKAIIVLGGNVAFVLKGIGTEIGGIAAQAVAFLSGDFARAAQIGQMMKADAVEARAKFDAWEKSILAVGRASSEAAKATKEMSEEDYEAARIAKDATDAANKKARAFLAGADAADKAAKAAKDPGLDDAHVTTELKHRIEMAKIANDEVQKAIDLEEQQRLAREATAGALRLSVEQLEFETTLLGKSNAEREIAIRLRALEKAGIDTSTASVAEYVERIRAAYEAQDGFRASQEALRVEASVWSELGQSVGNFFADLALNGKSAFDNLRAYLKRFLAELIALFAQRWVLQLGAALTGSTALSAAASATGQGSLAGSLLGSLGGAAGGLMQSGLSGILGGGTGGAVAASELIGMLSAAGPYVAAIAAVYSLYQAFKDKGENWKGKLGFGGNANAYTSTGPFGVQGFEYLAGSDGVNRQIQAFMASTGGLDRQLAGRLTPAQIAAITANLSGPYSTRADGQPSEFAFGKDDTTAMAQLTKEFLQKKYGTVFDEIDKTFADFIRNFGGTSEELLQAIGEFAGILDGLDQMGVKGLNIEALRSFQKEGESLADTFKRIAGQWNAYQEAFLTEGEKLDLVQGNLVAGFKALGIEVPASNEEFKKLVAGLDLSTEAGRKMFEGLMALAPAFASVSAATAQLLAQFKQIASARNSALGRVFIEQDLEAATKEFMGRNAWTNGMDWKEVARQINLITSYAGGAADFSRYSAADQQLILRILGITDSLEGLGNAATSAAGALGGLGNAGQAASDWLGIKGSLWDYLRGLYTDRTLSPLPQDQQLETLKQRFATTLAQARGGNIGAGQSLQGIIDEVLKLGRSLYGSTAAYDDLFKWITGQAADFVMPGGAAELQRLAYEEAKTANTNLLAINDVLIQIRDNAWAAADAVVKATEDSGEKAARAARSRVAVR